MALRILSLVNKKQEIISMADGESNTAIHFLAVYDVDTNEEQVCSIHVVHCKFMKYWGNALRSFVLSLYFEPQRNKLNLENYWMCCSRTVLISMLLTRLEIHHYIWRHKCKGLFRSR